MDWKDQPNLFANGMFRVNTPSGNVSWPLMGAYINAAGKWSLEWENTSNQLVSTPAENCTLIARKIEDMTDEEVELMTQSDPVNARDYLKEGTLNGGILSGRYLLHLLSIGVYPFDQSHFQDGTVLDSKEVL